MTVEIEITNRLSRMAEEQVRLTAELNRRYVLEEFIRSQGLEVPEGAITMKIGVIGGVVRSFRMNGERHEIKEGTSYPEELMAGQLKPPRR